MKALVKGGLRVTDVYRRPLRAPRHLFYLTCCMAALSASVPGSLLAQTAPDPAPAQAQSGTGFSGATSSPGVTTTRGESAKPATTQATAPAGVWDTGNGFQIQLNYTGEAAGNPSGGVKQGGAYADQFLVSVDADLQRLLGDTGGSVHFIGTQRDGKSLANQSIGNSLAPQEIYDGAETARITKLTYEQKLFDDRIDFEVGRMPAQGAFMTSPLYCNFQDVGVCGSPEIVFNDSNLTYFPPSTWGGHVKLFLNDRIFLHVGAFEVQPSTRQGNDHGLNFGLDGATGVVIPMELGYTTTSANDPYPRDYGVGAIVDRSPYSDPTLDVAGGRALLSGLPSQTDYGRSIVYARFDQTIYKPDPASQRALQLFGFAGGGTGGRQNQYYQLELGAVFTGPFASRPFDTLGLVVTDQRYSSLALSNVRAARASLGLGSGGIADSETLVELNYGIQVLPFMRFTPLVQYIFNPDNFNEPFRAKAIPDTFVIGGKLQVDFLTLVGLAKGPGQ